jgi:hypothetical protein
MRMTIGLENPRVRALEHTPWMNAREAVQGRDDNAGRISDPRHP